MITNSIHRIFVACFTCGCLATLTACSNFLEEQVPQATLTQDEVKRPEYIDNVLISAYAGLVTIEDMNASFSLWNYDVRSDDAYVGGSSFSDGEPFHHLEMGTGITTDAWPYRSIWEKLYQYLSRVSLSLDILASADQENATIQQRTAEMKFLRAYGHFQLKRLFKKIPFVNKLNMTEEDYNNLSNTEYTNDEGWQQIINDLEEAYAVLPAVQADKGRPKVHDSGCDFYKPSHNLVSAYRTNSNGLPMLDNFADAEYTVGSSQTVDPRLFVTVGVPGTPYMYNPSFMIAETNTWSRSGGTFGYFVSLKQNVDPALNDIYLYLCDSQWASSMNRVVFRYADVLLMRAEALAQLNQTTEAIALVNQVRERAAGMATNSVVSNYPNKYGVHYAVGKYSGSYSKDEAMKIVKMERRLELAMECERFFDLVRWGDAATVINKYYTTESQKMNFLSGSQFTADKNEYLPIPKEQMAASNGHYTQNCGQWQ